MRLFCRRLRVDFLVFRLFLIGVSSLILFGFTWTPFDKQHTALWFKVGAILTLKTPHYGASIWINGRLYGRAPVVPLFLTEGTYLIELKGYQAIPIAKTVILKAGQSQTIILRFSSPTQDSPSLLTPRTEFKKKPSLFEPHAQIEFASGLTTLNHQLPSHNTTFFQGDLNFTLLSSPQWKSQFTLTSRYLLDDSSFGSNQTWFPNLWTQWTSKQKRIAVRIGQWSEQWGPRFIGFQGLELYLRLKQHLFTTFFGRPHLKWSPSLGASQRPLLTSFFAGSPFSLKNQWRWNMSSSSWLRVSSLIESQLHSPVHSLTLLHLFFSSTHQERLIFLQGSTDHALTHSFKNNLNSAFIQGDAVWISTSLSQIYHQAWLRANIEQNGGGWTQSLNLRQRGFANESMHLNSLFWCKDLCLWMQGSTGSTESIKTYQAPWAIWNQGRFNSLSTLSWSLQWSTFRIWGHMRSGDLLHFPLKTEWIKYPPSFNQHSVDSFTPHSWQHIQVENGFKFSSVLTGAPFVRVGSTQVGSNQVQFGWSGMKLNWKLGQKWTMYAELKGIFTSVLDWGGETGVEWRSDVYSQTKPSGNPPDQLIFRLQCGRFFILPQVWIWFPQTLQCSFNLNLSSTSFNLK